MMRGMGNMQGMLKQVKKMQKEMMAAQEAFNSHCSYNFCKRSNRCFT